MTYRIRVCQTGTRSTLDGGYYRRTGAFSNVRPEEHQHTDIAATIRATRTLPRVREGIGKVWHWTTHSHVSPTEANGALRHRHRCISPLTALHSCSPVCPWRR
jgi:hypothetical protein